MIIQDWTFVRVPPVPDAGNGQPPSTSVVWLTPGGAPARLRDVGNARHVMDEALAAQTIEQPLYPPQRRSYVRFGFWFLQSM